MFECPVGLEGVESTLFEFEGVTCWIFISMFIIAVVVMGCVVKRRGGGDAVVVAGSGGNKGGTTRIRAWSKAFTFLKLLMISAVGGGCI